MMNIDDWRERCDINTNPEKYWEINVLIASLRPQGNVQLRSHEIISLYKSGLGIKKIARKLGLHTSSVHRILVAAKTKMRPPAGRKK